MSSKPNMKASELKKEVQEILKDRDVIIRGGKVQVRMGYYYRPCTAKEYENKISSLLGKNFSVEVEDYFNAWPRDSYYAAIITRN